jgi:hypothetical protein
MRSSCWARWASSSKQFSHRAVASTSFDPIRAARSLCLYRPGWTAFTLPIRKASNSPQAILEPDRFRGAVPLSRDTSTPAFIPTAQEVFGVGRKCSRRLTGKAPLAILAVPSPTRPRRRKCPGSSKARILRHAPVT